MACIDLHTSDGLLSGVDIVAYKKLNLRSYSKMVFHKISIDKDKWHLILCLCRSRFKNSIINIFPSLINPFLLTIDNLGHNVKSSYFGTKTAFKLSRIVTSIPVQC